jgi:hypothetical protein
MDADEVVERKFYRETVPATNEAQTGEVKCRTAARCVSALDLGPRLFVLAVVGVVDCLRLRLRLYARVRI